MSLEQQISLFPKWLVALVAILVFVLLLFTLNPPHTICDTQEQTLRENLIGVVYPLKVKKNTMPPRITQATVDCENARSSGGCYEYFNILKTVAKQIDGAHSECRAQLYKVKEVQATLRRGVENMALLAWGSRPPESSAARFGWLQESELAIFCQLKSSHIKAMGEDSWNQWRLETNRKYPTEGGEDAPKAVDRMSEQEIWSKSLFSVHCDSLI